MNRTKWSLIAVAAGLLVLGLGGAAYAFHSGGVAECVGCHSMHAPAAGGSFLLVGTDQSSACLTCHQNAADTGPSSYHVSTVDSKLTTGQAPLQRSPGGDFGWLKKTYTWVVRGSTNTEDGATHGHNIVAADFGYTVDPHNATAPGGSFPSAQLQCSSCHDPHGQYRRDSAGSVAKTGGPIIGSGSYNNSAVPGAGQTVGVYRLLAGDGYSKGGATFDGVPAAVVPSTYNRTESTTQTRTAYGHKTNNGHVAWGTWCATCHTGMHSDGNYVHPIDETLGSTVALNYQQYVKSGDMTGLAASSFSSLVPFIQNTGDYAALATVARNDDSQLGGPTTNDRVSCVSCHRAHASGFMHALRFNVEGEFMTYNSLWPGTDSTPSVPQFARGRTSAETQAAYYDRPPTKFASYQRVLCNKCHAKD